VVGGISSVVTVDKCPIVWLINSHTTKGRSKTVAIREGEAAGFWFRIRALAL